MDKIGFIVLHYNCLEESLKCIESILCMEGQEKIEIVVIDNASNNDSFEKLKRKYEFSKIIFLGNKKNVGFSRANNIACDYLCKNKEIKFIVFANNDIFFPQKDFVRKVEREYYKNRFSVLGPDIYNPRMKIHQSPLSKEMYRKKYFVRKTILLNKLALFFYGVYFKFFVENKPETMTQVPETEIHYQENVIPSGACLICSAELLDEKERIFFPETFFYYEEYILAWWCLTHKKRMVFDPDIKVYHNHGMATKSIGDRKKSVRFQMENTLRSAKIYLEVLRGKQ